MLPERHEKEIVVLFGSKQQRNYFWNSLIDFTNALQISIISLSLVEVVEYQFGSFAFCYLLLATPAKPGQLSLLPSYIPICSHFYSPPI